MNIKTKKHFLLNKNTQMARKTHDASSFKKKNRFQKEATNEICVCRS